MTNLKRTTQWLGLPAALMLALALPGGAEPAWKKVQGKLAGQKQASDANAGAAADAAAGAAEDDPEVKAMRESAAQGSAQSEAPQEVPVEGEPSSPESTGGTIGLPTAGTGTNATGAPQINLGKEGEDNAPVKNVFTDPQFLKMIGEKPVFIYNAVNRPDPMVFPPIRVAAIYLECMAVADAALLEGGFTSSTDRSRGTQGKPVNRAKIHEAVVALNKARQLDDPRYNPAIDRRLREIGDFLGALDQQAGVPEPTPAGPELIPTPAPLDPELPLEVAESTNGVIAGEEPFCLVGDSLLMVGDAVPAYPEVTVAAIGPGSVTFTVKQGDQSKDFPVEVKGYDDPGDVSQLSSGKQDRSRGRGRRR